MMIDGIPNRPKPILTKRTLVEPETCDEKREVIKQLNHRTGSLNSEKCWKMMEHVTGWWFGTFFILHNIWDVILPID